jgi:sialate O-acetylesterase
MVEMVARVLLGIVMFFTPAACTLRVHALFADHVVLQTTDDEGPGATVSGTGIHGERVDLLVSDDSGNTKFKAKTQIDEGDSWVISVNMTSGGPYSVTVIGSRSKETITAQDVMVGDVYLCSGQSNSE